MAPSEVAENAAKLCTLKALRPLLAPSRWPTRAMLAVNKTESPWRSLPVTAMLDLSGPKNCSDLPPRAPKVRAARPSKELQKHESSASPRLRRSSRLVKV